MQPWRLFFLLFIYLKSLVPLHPSCVSAFSPPFLSHRYIHFSLLHAFTSTLWGREQVMHCSSSLTAEQINRLKNNDSLCLNDDGLRLCELHSQGYDCLIASGLTWTAMAFMSCLWSFLWILSLQTRHTSWFWWLQFYNTPQYVHYEHLGIYQFSYASLLLYTTTLIWTFVSQSNKDPILYLKCTRAYFNFVPYLRK